MSTIRVICEECGGTGNTRVKEGPGYFVEKCPTCEGLGSRRATHADVEAELRRRSREQLEEGSPHYRLPAERMASGYVTRKPKTVPFAVTTGSIGARNATWPVVLGVLFGLLLWALLIWTALTLAGCAPGRQFARTGWIQNGTRDREIVSVGYSVVGRYFPFGEGVKVSAYIGTYYDAQGDVPYALIGGRLSWDAGAAGAYALTLDGYAPEDWEDAEYYLTASAEWPWP